MDDYEEMLKAFDDVYGEPESKFDREYLFAFAIFTKGWEHGKAFQQRVQLTDGGLSASDNESTPATIRN